MNIMYALLLASLSFTCLTAHATCIVTDRVYLLSQTGNQQECQVLQKPTRKTQLLTFPYLGTRSYDAPYWDAAVLRPGWKGDLYLVEVINVCTHQSHSVYDWQTAGAPNIMTLDNPNLDETIDNERSITSLLMTQSQANAAFKDLLDRCNQGLD